MKRYPVWGSLVFAAALIACSRGTADRAAPAAAPPLEPRLGGMGSTFESGEHSYGLVSRNLNTYQDKQFARGGAIFDEIGCASCHVGDGRSPGPSGDGPIPESMVLLAEDGTNLDIAVDVTYSEVDGTYADGIPWTLRRPAYELADDADRVVLLGDDPLVPRVAPSLIGLGLLEEVPLAGAEGRYGWQATQPSVASQTEVALAAHFDLTPEILGADQLYDLVFYTEALAVPVRREVDDREVAHGAEVFEEIGCTSCHVETLRTAATGSVQGFADQEIHPYTDLRTHDLGELGTWRTPPLWGIGLLEVVSGHSTFLHDGRARSLEESILWHHGEASDELDHWLALPATDRDALLRFLDAM